MYGLAAMLANDLTQLRFASWAEDWQGNEGRARPHAIVAGLAAEHKTVFLPQGG